MTRLRRKLPLKGAQSERWDTWKRLNHNLMNSRVTKDGGGCEGCGREDRPLEGDHLFGRMHLIEEPWASFFPLMAGLCTASIFEDDPGCHTRRHEHVDPELNASLGWQGFQRLCQAVGEPEAEVWGRKVYTKPLDAIRQLIGNLEEAGWHWSPEQGRIVNANEVAA